MSEHDETLTIARDDFQYQDRYRESLFGRLKFLLTATTLLIAGNLSITSQTPLDGPWRLIAVPSVIGWFLLFRLFYLVWQMYYGHDYKEPKSVLNYLDWQKDRIRQLEQVGFADPLEVSHQEILEFMIEDYAVAADWNRTVNLTVQAIMVQAARTVLWITLLLTIQAILFVVFILAR